MKKIAAVFAAALVFGAAAGAESIGKVISTDIVTFIDGSPIESYNYQDYTYVIAEDLQNYGFDVDWNEEQRRLDISRRERNFTPYVTDEINMPKDDNLFRPVFDVFSTDIKTYVNGKQVQSYNINGKTIINTDVLGEFGKCSYDNDSRTYSVDILSGEIETCESQVTQEYNDELGSVKTVETGYFENGELAYGIRKSESSDRWGNYVKIERGNFANGKTVEYSSSIKTSPEQIMVYKTPEKESYVGAQSGYEFGRFVMYEEEENGVKRLYLRKNAKLYFEGTLDESGGEGTLYKESQAIYTGKITNDTLKIQTGLHTDEFNVMYAPGYSDVYGVIYYFPPEEAAKYGGYEFYCGNVVNGVAHGSGELLAAYDFETKHNFNIESPSGTFSIFGMDGVSENLIYEGNFENGLPSGKGMIFDLGELRYAGKMKNGLKNGSGYEFNSWDANTMWLRFDANFENGLKNGYGREYSKTENGLWKRFDGTWKDGNWEKGQWYELNDNGEPALYYDGEFRYDGEKQYGTCYKYFNEETGEYEVKTGWFLDWKYVGE